MHILRDSSSMERSLNNKKGIDKELFDLHWIIMKKD